MYKPEEFRSNVGIILKNNFNKVFLGKRVRQSSWQFPQGGVEEGESVEECLFRELKEEIGVEQSDVRILACTRKWLYYKLPPKMQSKNKPFCVGQKQKWFLLELIPEEVEFKFDLGIKPEFDGWKWVNYWYPLREVIYFKKNVYRRALTELSVNVFKTRPTKDLNLSHLLTKFG